MQKRIECRLHIRDFDCEQLLLSGAGSGSKNTSSSCHYHNSWRELTLHSLCFAAKEIGLFSKEECTVAAVEAAVVGKFTNRYYRFHSNEHYMQIRAQAVAHMQSFFRERRPVGELVARFESFTAAIDELSIELTQYFHLLYYDASSHTYIVRRFMSEPKAELLELYYHVTTVFAATVFKGAAIRIEALCPLSGNIVCWHSDLRDIQPSLDYMAILRTLLLDKNISYALPN